MCRVKTFNKKNFDVLMRSLEAYESHIADKERFLRKYGEVFKLPKGVSKRNKIQYRNILEAIDIIRQTSIYNSK